MLSLDESESDCDSDMLSRFSDESYSPNDSQVFTLDNQEEAKEPSRWKDSPVCCSSQDHKDCVSFRSQRL